MSSTPPNDRPPYKGPTESTSEGEPFQKKIHGLCHCGQISYFLRTDTPLDVKYCHCHDCQVIHGAPFQLAAIFHKDDLAFDTGIKGLRFYQTSTKEAKYQLPCKVSCERCGTFIMDEGRNMALISPSLLCLETDKDREKFEVRKHIFYSRRVRDVPDGKPKWSGLDNKSDLLPDS